MYVRRPHPVLADYDIVVITTKVRHELLVPRSATEEEVLKLLVEHLQHYEETYPETRSEEVWSQLTSVLGEEVM